MAGTYGLAGTLTPVAGGSTQYLCGVVSGAAVSDGVIIWVDVTFDSASLGQGIQVDLFRATGGIPTNYSTTPIKLSSDAQTSSAMGSAWVTSGSNPLTVSPTGLTVIKNWYASPTGGVLVQYPLSREDYIIPGTTNWFGLRIVTPANVAPNCAYNLAWTE